MSATDLRLAHADCLLFVPGNRPERFAKAMASGAAAIVIDLEDAVAPEDKPQARREAAAWLAERGSGGAPWQGPMAMLRLNPPETRAGLDDLAMLADGGFAADALFLAKVESPRDIEFARAHDALGRPLAVAVETARGLHAATDIAAAMRPCDALVFGGADLAADLGSDMAWEPLLWARSLLVCAAAEAGLAALDVPYLELSDVDGLTAETRRSRALGFTGKIAIHPAQVAPIRAALTPDAETLARAQRIVAAMAEGGGAARIDGRMIDAPLFRAARRVLARAPRDPG
jgi:(S)-citramalyl-CoA lyase